MRFSGNAALCLLLTLCGTNALIAGDMANKQDPRAVEVLNQMAAYTSSLDKFIITGESNADATLGAGLIVSNASEITVKIDRPSALHLSNFDGVDTKDIYLDNGKLTVFGSETNFYARADVPEEIGKGMAFALSELDVEAPLGELFFAERALEILMDGTEILYLTDKSRIGGVDCHQIAFRGPEIDLQLWVTQGDMPVPRKMVMTMKWEGGSPRYSAVLNWEPVSTFAPGTFDFKPPEGAMEIQFLGNEQ